MSKKYKVAVAGATGAVGREMVKILEERDFPVETLKPLASSRSIGRKIEFRDQEIPVEALDTDSFKGFDLALFSAGASVSKEFAPYAVKSGCVVVDNSSAFRMESHIPLVVPEVNPKALKSHSGIIANPNCSTIQMVVALKPIYDAVGIERIVVSTYQAVSGTGQKAIEELADQTKALLSGGEVKNKVYPHRIAFNCLPHIDAFLDNDYTKEEMKMVNETRKILSDDSIMVSATTVRVPVFYSHSEAVWIETGKKIIPEEVRRLLKKAPGVSVLDDPSRNEYPLATNAAGKNDTFVGRIREDISCERGIVMWIVSDNVRKGAALNAVQIGEALTDKGLLKIS
ncbi:MAG: aspartate-semialdehyde dehydrogenase [Deltaproteobacteria bacterium]|nr:aspartate-semialdehyde dehydrogenase [Deltaproteobacteria bacterium]MBW2052785.1 aspartate-semialdehyde dehydrogenase [Deltaproteobacteria bacterium]MBW2140421.1 aspartate-semialdehyde dehydrogenase [Deltaproteobacteria bacterium]MBW2323804.1 aspartate-semialdehyde dehydrogenase [Deltaproteobacteria bacterium]